MRLDALDALWSDGARRAALLAWLASEPGQQAATSVFAAMACDLALSADTIICQLLTTADLIHRPLPPAARRRFGRGLLPERVEGRHRGGCTAVYWSGYAADAAERGRRHRQHTAPSHTTGRADRQRRIAGRRTGWLCDGRHTERTRSWRGDLWMLLLLLL